MQWIQDPVAEPDDGEIAKEMMGLTDRDYLLAFGYDVSRGGVSLRDLHWQVSACWGLSGYAIERSIFRWFVLI